jgi:hypothetical protein
MAAVVAGVLIGTKRSHHVPVADGPTWEDNSPTFEIEETPPKRIGRPVEQS